MAKTNKSQMIRDYKKNHPRQKPKQIAEELGKQGVTISAQFVSTVLSTAKRKQRKQGRRKAGPADRAATRQPVRKSAGGTASEVSYRSLLRAKEIVKEMGGISEARRALDALEKLTQP